MDQTHLCVCTNIWFAYHVVTDSVKSAVTEKKMQSVHLICAQQWKSLDPTAACLLPGWPGDWGRTPLQYHPAERGETTAERERFMTQAACNCWWFSNFQGLEKEDTEFLRFSVFCSMLCFLLPSSVSLLLTLSPSVCVCEIPVLQAALFIFTCQDTSTSVMDGMKLCCLPTATDVL